MREGLMDDCGCHEVDKAQILAEKYCIRCKNLPMEVDSNGDLWATDCDKDCSLADPKYFEEGGGDDV